MTNTYARKCLSDLPARSTAAGHYKAQLLLPTVTQSRANS